MLVRSVLTRSDLGGALIEGADFSDAVLDLSQKQVLFIACVCCRNMFPSKSDPSLSLFPLNSSVYS